MSQILNLAKRVQLSPDDDTFIQFGENIELSCSKIGRENQNRCCFFKKVKGDFEITSVEQNFLSGRRISCVLESNKFYVDGFPENESNIYTIYITVTIKVEEGLRAVNYELRVRRVHLQCLHMNQRIESTFVVPGYDGLEFAYCYKKIKTKGINDIWILIENPFENVQIQGQRGDLLFKQSSLNDVHLYLLIIFDSNIYPVSTNPMNQSTPKKLNSSFNSSFNRSFLDSPLKFNSPTSNFNSSFRSPNFNSSFRSPSFSLSKLQKIGSTFKYADVFFKFPDGTTIPSHRLLLDPASEVFERIFAENTKIPVEIEIEDFESEIVQAVVNFISGKFDAIKGKEKEVFKFALKYEIQEVVDECRSFLVETVDPSNVCERLQIAEENNFEELKQKCLQILVQNTHEIDDSQLDDLPKSVLLDALRLKF